MKKSIGGAMIPAGIFIGMGVGFITDQLVGGLFIGMGVGFVLMVLIEVFTKSDNKAEE